MVQKSQGRRTYRTANGKSIDLDLLIQRNELTPAAGNARVNARGDQLGPGGKIIKKREDVLRDYYKESPTVPDEAARPKAAPPVADNVKATSKKETPAKPTKAAAKPTDKELKQMEEFDEGWEEDEDGNFVKKGDK